MLQTEKSNFIHPTSIIDKSVKMGSGNYIGPFCLIGPNVTIGNNNRIEAYASIGSPPEHKDFWHTEYKGVKIEDNCIIREFTTINAGSVIDTHIGNNALILRGTYVGHDSIIHKDVTLSCNVILGGHTEIFAGANLGLGAITHQYSKIGHYAMLGMACVVTKKSDIQPFNTYVGSPARLLKRNQHIINKLKLTEEFISECTKIFNKKPKLKIAL
jgi:UDP-N-acetylglucosamine acyltransferase